MCHDNILPPKLIHVGEITISVYWKKDRPKSNVHFIKRTCPGCSYVFEPLDHDRYCIDCRIGDMRYQQHLAMKRELGSWR